MTAALTSLPLALDLPSGGHLRPAAGSRAGVEFYIGLHQPSDAWPFRRAMISVNRLRARKSAFRVNEWIMDSGAFTEVSTHGRWRTEPEVYADEINRLKGNGRLLAAVTQDMMCEAFILEKTGLSVEAHQEITVQRYARICAATDAHVMPVLQGFAPETYMRHVGMYGPLLSPGAWCGVGSVCKRNGSPEQIEDVLLAIKSVRPDLRLHGFGLKIEALRSGTVRSLLHSADSMAWCYNQGWNGGDANDPRAALRYAAAVESITGQPSFVQTRLFDAWHTEKPENNRTVASAADGDQ